MNNFKKNYGDWALITGASSGLGVEFAKQLAELGLNLILVARRRGRLENLAKSLGRDHHIQIKIVSVDLSTDTFASTIRSVTDNLEIGLLVNNAGFSITGEFISNSIEREVEMLYVNTRAPLILTHEFGQHMKVRQKGGIIFVSSIAGFNAMPLWSHYAATKAYNLLLGEGLSYELQKYGVHVLTLCPGSTRTEFQQIAGVNEGKAMEPYKVVSLAIKELGKKATIVPGFHNKFLVTISKFLPRWLNTKKGSFIVNHIKKR